MTRKRKRSSGKVEKKGISITYENDPETSSVDINIDGSQGEGGGQIVRASLALSTILNLSVRITRIRYGRSKPGLQAQHASGANLVAHVAGGELRGANVGSLTLTYIPRNEIVPISTDSSVSDTNLPLKCVVGTAGSTALIMQAALPAALRFLPGSVEIPALRVHGGTSVAFAPVSDYVRFVLSPNLRVLFGITLQYEVQRHGFYPRGGGECVISVDKTACMRARNENGCLIGSMLQPCDIVSRGDIIKIAGVVLIHGASYARAGVAQAMQQAAERTLRAKGLTALCSEDDKPGFSRAQASDTRIRLEELASGEASDRVACITLYATTACGTVLGASALWTERDVNKLQTINDSVNKLDLADLWRRSATLVAESAAQDLCAAIQSGAAVDSYMADQVCIFMAMAKGSSRLLIPQPTKHVLSVVAVSKMYGIDIRLEPIEGSSNMMLLCEGKGVLLK